MSETAAERSLRASIAANARWSRESPYGPDSTPAKARAGFERRFLDEVDPDRTLPEPERLRRAEALRRAHMTRLALQTWAEALRDPVLHKRARALYLETLDHIAELAGRWRDEGYIPPNSDTNAVAASLFSLMHGLIVMHHLVDDVPSEALRNGLSLLGAAVVGPYTLPATAPQEAKP